MKAVYKITKWLSNIVALMAVLGMGILALLMIVPKVMGQQPYIVLSGSMEPLIPTGSVVYVEALDHKPVEGDIVSYVLGDVQVIHRVYSVNDDGSYITKGDNNDITDAAPVKPSQITGQYARHIPVLGYLIAWFESHTVALGRFKVPAVVLIMAGVVILLAVVHTLVGCLVELKE